MALKWILKELKDLQQDPPIPHAELGLGAVWSLILGRPHYRQSCLYITLKTDEEVESLRKKFAGIKADRKEREEAEAVKVAAQLKKTLEGLLGVGLSTHEQMEVRHE